MANLNPKYYASHVHTVSNSSKERVPVELFLDYNCPFSAKLFTKVNKELIPLLKEQGIADNFEFVFINVVQPWHHLNSGTQHEVALAVAKLYPDQFWKFSQALFDHIAEYYDTELYETTRKQVYAKLIKLAVDTLDNVDAEKIWDLVQIQPSATPANKGNKIAVDLKYFTRYERTIGVHVTPTVSVSGIIAPNVESSTDASKIADILSAQL